MVEDLANSQYLMRAYASSSDSWENFRLTGRQSSLHEVAFALCGAWTLLSEDDDFFAGLSDASARARLWTLPAPPPLTDDQKHADEFQQHMDVDKLLARELVVLADAGMDPRHVMRLATDVGTLLTEGIDNTFSWDNVDSFQAEVTGLAEQLCKAHNRLKAFDYDPPLEIAARRPPHRTWMSRMRKVGQALAATAGVASAAGNVAASIASFGVVTGLGLASVVAGAQATRTAVRALEHNN